MPKHNKKKPCTSNKPFIEDKPWMVTESICARSGVEHKFVNVIPKFGTKHSPCPDCWCEPKLEEYPNGTCLIHSPDTQKITLNTSVVNGQLNIVIYFSALIQYKKKYYEKI